MIHMEHNVHKLEEYVASCLEKENMPLVIAVDFDGVIHKGNYPALGELMDNCKEVLDRLVDIGAVIVLNTCRTDDLLLQAKIFCVSKGLPIYLFNQNEPGRVEEYGGDSRKISADLYIDDKNFPGGFPGWLEIYKKIEEIEILVDIYKKGRWNK